jgi:hypothetical protein
MTEHATPDLVARVERLERENRRLKRLATAATILLAAGLLLAPAAPKTVPKLLKAREVQVVDDEGAPRITLALAASGDPELRIAGSKGSGIRLGLAQDHPALSLRDENRERASIEVGESATALGLEDADGKRAARLEAGTALGVFVDDSRSGRREVSLGVSDEGASLSLSAPDEADMPTVSLQLSPVSGPGLALTSGLAGTTLNVSREGEPSVTLTDTQGRDRAVLGVTRLEIETRSRKKGKPIEKRKTDVSSVVLFDSDETVIWKTP